MKHPGSFSTVIASSLLAAAVLASIAAAQTEPAENPAVRFAQRDAERAAAFVAELESLAQAEAGPEAKALEGARSTKAALEAAIAGVDAGLRSAGERKSAAEKGAAGAAAALEAARENVAAADAALAAAATAAEGGQAELVLLKEAQATAAADLADATAALEQAKQGEADGAQKASRLVEVRQRLAKAAANAVASQEKEAARLAAAQQAQASAAGNAKKTVAEMTAALAAVQQQLAVAEKEIAQLASEKDRLAALLKKADELLKELEELYGPKTEQRAQAAGRLEAARKLAGEFAARAEKLAGSPPAADPAAAREITKLDLERPAIACRFDAGGTWLLAGAQDKNLFRWDLVTGEKTVLAGHQTWIRRMSLDKSGGLLASGDYSGQAAIWRVGDAAPVPLRLASAHQGYCRAVAVSPDGRFLATGGNDGMVRVWDAATGQQLAEMDAHLKEKKVEELADKPERVFINHVYNVAFDPTGRYLASGDLVGVVKLWEVESWRHVRDLDAGMLHKYDPTFRAHCGGIRGMDFSPDGTKLAVCGIGEVTNAFAGVGKPTAAVFEVETGNRLSVHKPADNFQGTCWSVRFHPSGEWLVGAGGGGSGALWFWKPGEEKPFHSMKAPSVAYDVALHPDGLRMAVALYDKTVRLYELRGE